MAKKVQEAEAYSLTNYNEYHMSFFEKVKYFLVGAVFVSAIGFVFYRSIPVCVVLSVFGLFYPKIKKKGIIAKRKKNLNYQFKEALFSLASSMGAAGKSPETAFRDALKDLAILYPDPQTDILIEFSVIVNRIEVGETLETALFDFAQRADLEDITNFVDVFITCKRRGGNLVDVIRNTSRVLADKITIKRDIDTLLSSKKFEQNIMMVMPVFFVLFLSVSSAEYMEPMFTEVMGRIIMTVVIAIWGISFLISRKIMSIEV